MKTIDLDSHSRPIPQDYNVEGDSHCRQKMCGVFRPGFTRDGTVNEQTTVRVLTQADKIKELKEIPPQKRFSIISFARKAHAELKLTGLTAPQ